LNDLRNEGDVKFGLSNLLLAWREAKYVNLTLDKGRLDQSSHSIHQHQSTKAASPT
jgi:hypothetical protein